MTIPQFTIPQF
ncbi:hypothetical protein Zm00014a_029996 [Zea mays]|nr:hypothetical protein Zm00014a_018100 [Zea mays]PWZ32405.1 hypothetical protein Zm00014a_029996 [Zea mays]